MRIFILGLNHKTASIDIRERLAYDPEATLMALKQLKERYPAGEFVLLSTCNRVEIYCATENSEELGPDDIVKFLSESRGVGAEEFKDLLYTSFNEDSVIHLLTVTSSLDSMVVGESQINAQVKESYRLAREVNSAGKVLNHLFHCAFNTSKEIYTSTSITKQRVSVAGVAVELAKQLFEDINSAKVIVVGAGEMGELLVEHFLNIKCGNITVINRSAKKGKSVAGRYGVSFNEWSNLDKELLEANIVVGAATATQGHLFNKDSFTEVMAQRRGRTLLLIDIAVPRNFAPEINEIENVYLYSVDDLAQVVQENIELRQEDVAQAIEIICEKATEFMDWFTTKDIGPLIGQIKATFDQIRQNEMDRFFVGHRQDANCKEVMEQTVSRVVHKLLHCVIKNISIIAKEQGAADATKLASSIVEHAQEVLVEDKEKRKGQ